MRNMGCAQPPRQGSRLLFIFHNFLPSLFFSFFHAVSLGLRGAIDKHTTHYHFWTWHHLGPWQRHVTTYYCLDLMTPPAAGRGDCPFQHDLYWTIITHVFGRKRKWLSDTGETQSKITIHLRVMCAAVVSPGSRGPLASNRSALAHLSLFMQRSTVNPTPWPSHAPMPAMRVPRGQAIWNVLVKASPTLWPPGHLLSRFECDRPV